MVFCDKHRYIKVTEASEKVSTGAALQCKQVPHLSSHSRAEQTRHQRLVTSCTETFMPKETENLPSCRQFASETKLDGDYDADRAI